MLYVWVFCHTTDINTIVQFCPNRPEDTLVNACNSWRDADLTQECLETNFHLFSTLLRKLCVHYANGFDNVESVYFFYSNSV
jgi:hypothetical protein